MPHRLVNPLVLTLALAPSQADVGASCIALSERSYGQLRGGKGFGRVCEGGSGC